MLRALNADDPTHGDVEMHDSDDAGGADLMHHAPTGVGDGQGVPKLNDLPNTPTPRGRAVTSRPRASFAFRTATVERAMPVPPTAPLEDSEHGRATLGQGVHRPAQEANYEMLDGERASRQHLDHFTVTTRTHLAASTSTDRFTAAITSAPASHASCVIADTRVCADTTTPVAAAAPAAVSPTAPSEAYAARACSTDYRTTRATTAITSAPASRDTCVSTDTRVSADTTASLSAATSAADPPTALSATRAATDTSAGQLPRSAGERRHLGEWVPTGRAAVRSVDGELQSLLERDRDTPARAERERGRYHPHGTRAGVGLAAGSAAARLEIHRFTMVCSQAGCAALVDLRSAKAAATRAGRLDFEAGDGCASRACSRSHHWRSGRFTTEQAKMARLLREGQRRLIAWPRDGDDKRRWFRPAAAAEAAAAAALTTLSAPTLPAVPPSPTPHPAALAALVALAAAEPAALAAEAAPSGQTRASVLALAALTTAEPAALAAALVATRPDAPTHAALAALVALAAAAAAEPTTLATILATADPATLDAAAGAGLTALAAADHAALAAALAATTPAACSHATVAAVATLAATDEPPATLPNAATPTLTPLPTPTAVSMALSTLSSALAAGPLEPSAAATLVALASHPSLSPLR